VFRFFLFRFPQNPFFRHFVEDGQLGAQVVQADPEFVGRGLEHVAIHGV
jgi:hypothetical protein